MFERDFLAKIAAGIISKDEERTHFEETGSDMVHYDFELLKVDQPVFTSGRAGEFYKFTFEYELTFLDEAHLAGKENEVRTYRRSVRLSPDGNVTGLSDRIELLD